MANDNEDRDSGWDISPNVQRCLCVAGGVIGTIAVKALIDYTLKKIGNAGSAQS